MLLLESRTSSSPSAPAKARKNDRFFDRQLRLLLLRCTGWLAARYIFNDLDDMKASFDSPVIAAAKEAVVAHPHYDSSREPVEFKVWIAPCPLFLRGGEI